MTSQASASPQKDMLSFSGLADILHRRGWRNFGRENLSASLPAVVPPVSVDTRTDMDKSYTFSNGQRSH